jgi:hypothetical protein
MRNNLRKARKSATLDALFPSIRRRLLAVVLTSPDRWWYLSELAVALGTSPSSLQRELFSLTSVRILEKSCRKARPYFRAYRRSPIYEELSGIFEKKAEFHPTEHPRSAVNPNVDRGAHKLIAGIRKRREQFPRLQIAKMWIEGREIPEIASAIGRVDWRSKNGDLYHSLRNCLSRMHTGYTDESGRIVKLPYRVSARTIRRATKAGRKATSR